jgi:hypothetical protein
MSYQTFEEYVKNRDAELYDEVFGLNNMSKGLKRFGQGAALATAAMTGLGGMGADNYAMGQQPNQQQVVQSVNQEMDQVAQSQFKNMLKSGKSLPEVMKIWDQYRPNEPINIQLYKNQQTKLQGLLPIILNVSIENDVVKVTVEKQTADTSRTERQKAAFHARMMMSQILGGEVNSGIRSNAEQTNNGGYKGIATWSAKSQNLAQQAGSGSEDGGGGVRTSSDYDF